jgi:hypothetical protein
MPTTGSGIGVAATGIGMRVLSNASLECLERAIIVIELGQVGYQDCADPV